MPTGKRGSRPFYTARRCGRARSFLPLCMAWGRGFFNTVCVFLTLSGLLPRPARPGWAGRAGDILSRKLAEFYKKKQITFYMWFHAAPAAWNHVGLKNESN